MKVKKRTLLLIASIVWLIAGFNVFYIGIDSYGKYINVINISISILVFCIFWFNIFKKLVFKNTLRIKNFNEDLQLFLKFFDKKSFIMMFFMMFLGISIRKFNLLPEVFIAVFYAGLGASLFLAGIAFFYNYIKEK